MIFVLALPSGIAVFLTLLEFAFSFVIQRLVTTCITTSCIATPFTSCAVKNSEVLGAILRILEILTIPML